MTESNPIHKPESPRPGDHRATYTRNKQTGALQVRVVGPNAAFASGQTIPVTRRDSAVNMVKLGDLVFEGTDNYEAPDYKPTGLPMAIYEIVKQPRETRELAFNS